MEILIIASLPVLVLAAITFISLERPFPHK